ncbi:MAG: hypothetical protein NTW52_04855 [Planctomycetota bacterium]|nr:hypothetical protein [Planctomycetota bacterium]
MKTFVVGLCLVGLFSLSGSARAQCGCSGPAHISYAPAVHAPVAVAPRPVAPAPASAANISYVNRLTEPIVRPNYTLLYAVHLTDGRVLLTEVVPRGHNVSGTEFRSTGRKVNAADIGNGQVRVTDPTTNQMIATFGR